VALAVSGEILAVALGETLAVPGEILPVSGEALAVVEREIPWVVRGADLTWGP
jgi:hypothetical protein